MPTVFVYRDCCFYLDVALAGCSTVTCIPLENLTGRGKQVQPLVGGHLQLEPQKYKNLKI